MAKHDTEMQTRTKSIDKKKIIEKITEEIKPTKITYQGLCLTCENTATCTFPRNVTRPVWHCEEFDTYTPSQISNEIPSTVGPQLNSGYAKKDIPQYQGLCSNCENIKSCTYPKPEGGVWHCEEYK